jgi:hypothetical protein
MNNPTDQHLLNTLATLLNQANPIPQEVLADAIAAGLRLTKREPRLKTRIMDQAWLLPA